MDSTGLVLLSAALGLIVGAGFVVLLNLASGRGSHAASVASSGVPDGVRHMLDALESPAVVLDASNNVAAASPAAYAAALVWDDRLVHAELAGLVDDVRSGGETLTRELELARGPLGHGSVILHARAAGLGSRYVLLLADDRTESVRLDEVRRDFIANISHELKTPIASLALLSEAIEGSAADPERVRRFAEHLADETQRLKRITEDVIELSRLQSANALTDPSRVDVAAVVAAAIEANGVAASARNISLVAGRIPETAVYGVERVLVAAVHNLIVNAIQHSPDDSRVGIGVKAADGAIEIAVTDQGEGIPEHEHSRIFERFYRVDPARSRQTGGTGLGLSIVKHAVQEHGGQVSVWSKPGEGSTFTIRLPLAAAAPRPAATVIEGDA
ncbi:ATP-binding protein [Microbacterium sp. STN6]|uniref:sensor histidine kinase n=1 Tax=Microbacterium sp. STN6 TaxID=2995588 RepID=UPI00226103D7|nr:ATP-binding protein [Microbacterium sp. STN6]MCX7523385.1 ATP-binding protein [Microbacterium sp. STN6]